MTAGREKTGGVSTGYVEDFFGPRMTRMAADRSSQQVGGVDEGQASDPTTM